MSEIIYDPDLSEEDLITLRRYVGRVMREWRKNPNAQVETLVQDPQYQVSGFQRSITVSFVMAAGLGISALGILADSTLWLYGGAGITSLGFASLPKTTDRGGKSRRQIREEISENTRGREIFSHAVLPIFQLDFRQKAILCGARKHIQTISRSRSRKEDTYLDSMCDVALPRHLWEIAESLREHTRLTRKLHKALEKGPETPVTRAQGAMAERALESVRQRVDALGEYAEQIRRADEQIALMHRDEGLATDMDEYLDLVARTIRDEKAVEETRALASQAEELRFRITELMLPLREEGTLLLGYEITKG